MLAVFLCGTVSFAAEYDFVWSGGTTGTQYYQVSSNWTPAGLPSAGKKVLINQSINTLVNSSTSTDRLEIIEHDLTFQGTAESPITVGLNVRIQVKGGSSVTIENASLPVTVDGNGSSILIVGCGSTNGEYGTGTLTLGTGGILRANGKEGRLQVGGNQGSANFLGYGEVYIQPGGILSAGNEVVIGGRTTADRIGNVAGYLKLEGKIETPMVAISGQAKGKLDIVGGEIAPEVASGTAIINMGHRYQIADGYYLHPSELNLVEGTLTDSKLRFVSRGSECNVIGDNDGATWQLSKGIESAKTVASINYNSSQDPIYWNFSATHEGGWGKVNSETVTLQDDLTVRAGLYGGLGVFETNSQTILTATTLTNTATLSSDALFTVTQNGETLVASLNPTASQGELELDTAIDTNSASGFVKLSEGISDSGAYDLIFSVNGLDGTNRSSFEDLLVGGEFEDVPWELSSTGDSFKLSNFSALGGEYFAWDFRSLEGVTMASLSALQGAAGVPEPTSWMLLILGMFGLLRLRKR